MGVKIRFPILLLFFLVLSLFIFNAAHASAQAGDSVRVITLSQSGYEQAYDISFSSDGEYFAVGGTSGIYLFDAQKLSKIDLIQTNARARSVVFLPGSNTLAAGLFDNTIKLWQIPEDRLLTTLQGHQGWVRSISVSGDGSLLASASDDNTIRVWKVSSGNLLLKLDKNTDGVRAVALSPDGKLVAGALGDNTIRLWSVPDGNLLDTLVGHTSWVRCLAFSPDGSLLASGSFDMTVRLWKVSDGTLLQTMRGHTSSILKVAFSPDGISLASSSVDETVRLWRISDGNLISILQGYTDFIYALAFSPDGKTLASGGGDNAIRLWNLDELGVNSLAITGSIDNPVDIQSSTPDCRQCHHRLGNKPARVIELSCEGCHAGGIGLTWCPNFQRAGLVNSTPTTYNEIQEVSGLPVNGRDIAIVLASPGNGETLYVNPNNLVQETIRGKVFYGDKESISRVKIQLEIISGGQIMNSFFTFPSIDGNFNFGVELNPGSPSPALWKFCLTCHDYANSGAVLPQGDVRIIVTAIAPDGQQATDERWFRVGSSKEVTIPVQMVDDVSGKPISNLSVQASTILYEWRARNTGSGSDANGMVQLNLESLSLTPTMYSISVPAQVLNGLLYTSDDIVQVMLEPGKITYPTITMTAHAQAGTLIGNLTGEDLPNALEGTDIWAIRLPAGPVYKVPLALNNTFIFEDIPIDNYLVIADPYRLAGNGLNTVSQTVDLVQSSQATISMAVTKNRTFSGKVTAPDGSALAFAWVMVGENTSAVPINPISGEYLISDLPSDATFLTVSAPGYYSLSQQIDPAAKTLDFQLISKPDVRHISWGNGEVNLAPETKITINGLDIDLEQGWIWGNGGTSSTLIIHLPGLDVSISNGKFALESPVGGGTAWFYLYDGNAKVISNESGTSTELGNGEMIALLDGAKPIAMEESVAAGLHPPIDEISTPEIVKPSLLLQIENWLVKAGIGVAQTTTTITYFLSLTVLVGIPMIAIIWVKKKRQNSSSSK